MDILRNQLVKELLYYKIGGTVKYLLKCESSEDLENALYYIHQNNIKNYIVIGLGSNVLMPDDLYDGAVILLGRKKEAQLELVDDVKVRAYAGETFDALINFAFDNNLVGLEWAGGLPGTVGGAVRGNAGAFGGATKDTVEKVEIYQIVDDGVEKKELSNADCNFAYRHSCIKDNPHLIVKNALFSLKKGTQEEVKEARRVYKDHIHYRNTNHPMHFPSCGSVFKNIRRKEQVDNMLKIWPDTEELVKGKWHNKFSMGYCIKRFGLQGKVVGGAQISEDHANYILNIDNAKYADVLQLIQLIKDKFTNTFGFTPEPELQIVT